ncbi:MAG TPA: DUF6527 family protein [Candidatus Elarobacter sp.]|jgi:hypothetical protein|nr:DUF6527 family protein [Candidatus Elarobacter sp.]
MKTTVFRHVFVETLPEALEHEVLYISPKHAAAVHYCACGCGKEVVTPFNPTTGWKLKFDGKSVSLCPSIGNWRLPCRSHYYIKRNRIEWVPRMSDEEIAAGRQADMRARGKQPLSGPAAAKKKKPFWKFWERN